jgi:hypothetical protein
MEFQELFGNYARTGTVCWIGIRSARKIPLIEVATVIAMEDAGLEGDRYQKKAGQGR